MNGKKFKYEMEEQVVTYILNALNRTQIVGVQQANDLLAVTKILQSPLNAEDLEKESYETLKNKFEPKKEKK
jgi:hypothetical protein